MRALESILSDEFDIQLTLLDVAKYVISHRATNKTREYVQNALNALCPERCGDRLTKYDCYCEYDRGDLVITFNTGNKLPGTFKGDCYRLGYKKDSTFWTPVEFYDGKFQQLDLHIVPKQMELEIRGWLEQNYKGKL